MEKQTHTPGPWLLAGDAQGPCMVMHPTRKSVAIANLGGTFQPKGGYHDDWYVYRDDKTLDSEATRARIEERNANARLIAAAPELLAAAKAIEGQARPRPRVIAGPAVEYTISRELFDALRAAIARATAEHP